jgi:hypothetical protein
MRKDASQPQRTLRRDGPTREGRQRAQARLIRQDVLNGVVGEAVVKAVQATPNAKLCSEHAPQIGA